MIQPQHEHHSRTMIGAAGGKLMNAKRLRASSTVE
jgi:hypothetical protein